MEGKYFVFDWEADYTEGRRAFAIMQVVDGSLEERFHPDNDGEGLFGGEDEKVISYLREKGVKKVYTPDYSPEAPDRFLGYILWWREELKDPELVPGQWEYYLYNTISWCGDRSRIEFLKKRGIEVEIVDHRPYVTSPIADPVEPDPQLAFEFER